MGLFKILTIRCVIFFVMNETFEWFLCILIKVLIKIRTKFFYNSYIFIMHPFAARLIVSVMFTGSNDSIYVSA